MAKARYRKETIKFDNDPASLEKWASMVNEGFQDGYAFPHYEPNEDEDVQELTFRIRAIYSPNGQIQVQSMLPNFSAQPPISFKLNKTFEGQQVHARRIRHSFYEELNKHLPTSAHTLMSALIVKENDGSSHKSRKEACDRLIENFVTLYKALLVWDRWDVISEEDLPGIGKRIVKEPRGSGNRAEFTKEELHEESIAACVKLLEKRLKVTLHNAGDIVYPKTQADTGEKLRKALGHYDLDWKEIKRTAKIIFLKVAKGSKAER